MSFALKIMTVTEEAKVFLSPYEERKLHDIAKKKKKTIVILIDLVVSSLHAYMVNDLA